MMTEPNFNAYNDIPEEESQRSLEDYISQFFYRTDSPLRAEQPPQSQHAIVVEETPQIVQRSPEPVSLHRKKVDSSSKSKKRNRKIKTSPFHNYQKHLNTALKHMISLPEETQNSSQAYFAAAQLWREFVGSQNTTKKILHFIFNEHNQHVIEDSQLRELGLYELYQSFNPDDLKEAKKMLSALALEQITEDNIDNYLSKRRIRNTMKFKKYMQQFKKELEDGFLKKRFTNRSRKIGRSARNE